MSKFKPTKEYRDVDEIVLDLANFAVKNNIKGRYDLDDHEIKLINDNAIDKDHPLEIVYIVPPGSCKTIKNGKLVDSISEYGLIRLYSENMNPKYSYRKIGNKIEIDSA